MRRDNYLRDLDLGAGYHLNQDNPVMHEVAQGNGLWAFTRTTDGRYVLAAELIVQAKTKNRPDFRYGTYRVRRRPVAILSGQRRAQRRANHPVTVNSRGSAGAGTLLSGPRRRPQDYG